MMRKPDDAAATPLVSLTNSVLVSLIEIGKMRKSQKLNDRIGGATVAAAAEASSQ